MFIFYDKFYFIKLEMKLKEVVLDYVIIEVEMISWKLYFLREIRGEKEYDKCEFVFIL